MIWSVVFLLKPVGLMIYMHVYRYTHICMCAHCLQRSEVNVRCLSLVILYLFEIGSVAEPEAHQQARLPGCQLHSNRCSSSQLSMYSSTAFLRQGITQSSLVLMLLPSFPSAEIQVCTTTLHYLNILYYNKNVLNTEIQISQFLKLSFIFKPKY